MCLAVPSRVVATDGSVATVEAFGERREVSLLLLDEAVRVGDYLLVQVGGHAFRKIEPDLARESLALMEQVFLADGADIRAF